jgi:CO/xanthine dehydrogenase FAD-binding subunit
MGLLEGRKAHASAFEAGVTALEVHVFAGPQQPHDLATAVDLDPEGRVEDARIVLGAAGPTVLRARAAEGALRGSILSADLMREAGALARDASDPLDDARGSAAYKKEMVAVWVRRSLERVSLL